MTYVTTTSRKTSAGKKTSTKPQTINQKSHAAHTGSACCLSADARLGLIAEGAYRRAAARNFVGDAEIQDWLEAEAEVNEKFPLMEDLS